MASSNDDTAGWSADQAWDELGRIREAIEECVPCRLIGTGEGAEPTLAREVLAPIEAIRLMGAHMPKQLDEMVLAEFRAWAADASEIGSAAIDDADPSPGTHGLL